MVITEKSTSSSKNSFEQALYYLVINSSFVSNIGLFHGKMGLVLYFSFYARYSNDDQYNRIAYDLLDEIYEDNYVELDGRLSIWYKMDIWKEIRMKYWKILISVSWNMMSVEFRI